MSFQNYFVYKERVYGIGTKVRITPYAEFFIVRGSLTKTKNSIEVKEQIYTFTGGTTGGKFVFWWKETDDPWEQYTARSQAIIKCIDDEVLEIIEPVYVELVSWQKNAISNIIKRELPTDVFGGVLMYIVIMLIAFIFKDRWMIWITTTVIFGWWLLNQYRT